MLVSDGPLHAALVKFVKRYLSILKVHPYLNEGHSYTLHVSFKNCINTTTHRGKHANTKKNKHSLTDVATLITKIVDEKRH